MKGNSRIYNGVYQVCEWVMKFAVSNLLWLFFNLPILFVIGNWIFTEEESTRIFLIFPLVILMPFVFFPATATLIAFARDLVKGKEGTKLVRTYWKHYRDNYKLNMISGIVFTLIWGIWFADYHYLGTENVLFMFIFGIFGILLYVYTVNFYSLAAHYNMSLGLLFKNTFYITIGSPILLFAIVISHFLILYISFQVPFIFITFFTGSVMTFLSFSAFYRLYLKIVKSV